MKLQVLVSTMQLKDPIKLAKKMNIQCDAIIINQSHSFSYTKDKFGPNSIETYTLNEKGIGLSRNTALMRAQSSICLIADDDVVYVDRYADKVVNAFKENPTIGTYFTFRNIGDDYKETPYVFGEIVSLEEDKIILTYESLCIFHKQHGI